MDNVLLILFGAVIGFIVTKGFSMNLKEKTGTGGSTSSPIEPMNPDKNHPSGPNELEQAE